ncbi:MAG: hypothetical protein KF773_26080 [Deltaproteobacteria bacterium]|nr:hypothetical protein [Deltaproteobacteria bacterium]MCW5802592.1 hypothetical protein [Deltaproteobacteria bacterium]
MRLVARLLVVVSLGACASASKDNASPSPAREVVTGAGRVRGNGVRMDVSVGAAFATTPVKNATTTARPNKPVTP